MMATVPPFFVVRRVLHFQRSHGRG
ncbi:unnamed protein product [Ectocarpus sp. CCAP 1310/34]|nr:unnamed protein product [Ectocarpus sp. CCAP 1310/34]